MPVIGSPPPPISAHPVNTPLTPDMMKAKRRAKGLDKAANKAYGLVGLGLILFIIAGGMIFGSRSPFVLCMGLAFLCMFSGVISVIFSVAKYSK
jgi:hypothetical protein